MDKAYEALADAEFVLELLEKCDDKRLFRIYFIASMTLLRTVGQVLVSKSADPNTKATALKVFAEQKPDDESNKIFFEFIKKERDIIIHEYEINLDCDDWDVVYSDGVDFGTFNLGELYRPLSDLSFEGTDVRDLLENSIIWWKQQLVAIEKELKSVK